MAPQWLTLALLMIVDVLSGDGKPATFVSPYQIAILESKGIKESSGVARSRIMPDRLWTHNDSGDEPRLHAVDLQGRDLGSVRINVPRAVDWEDLASFVWLGKNYLLIADTGNNVRDRRSLQLHLVEEPAEIVGAPALIWTRTFRFPTQPQDCEAIAVDRRDERIYLATKHLQNNASIYWLPLQKPVASEVETATTLINVPVRLATGMAISDGSDQLAIVNYTHVHRWTRSPTESWAEALARPAMTWLVMGRPQGESICFAADGKSVLLTSEGNSSPLLRLPLDPPSK